MSPTAESGLVPPTAGLSRPVERRREALGPVNGAREARRTASAPSGRGGDARLGGETFEARDRGVRQIPATRREQDAGDIVRLRDAGPAIGPEIDQRPLGAARDDDRLRRLDVEALAQPLVAIERAHVGERDVPQHAVRRWRWRRASPSASPRA